MDLSGLNRFYNIDKLIEYYTPVLPKVAWATDYFKNPSISSTFISGVGRLVFEFDVTTLDDNELELAIQLATDLDDDGNYPIQILNGRIESIDARNMGANDPGVTLLGERIVSKTITDI